MTRSLIVTKNISIIVIWHGHQNLFPKIKKQTTKKNKTTERKLRPTCISSSIQFQLIFASSLFFVTAKVHVSFISVSVTASSSSSSSLLISFFYCGRPRRRWWNKTIRFNRIVIVLINIIYIFISCTPFTFARILSNTKNFYDFLKNDLSFTHK